MKSYTARSGLLTLGMGTGTAKAFLVLGREIISKLPKLQDWSFVNENFKDRDSNKLTLVEVQCIVLFCYPWR